MYPFFIATARPRQAIYASRGQQPPPPNPVLPSPTEISSSAAVSTSGVADATGEEIQGASSQANASAGIDEGGQSSDEDDDRDSRARENKNFPGEEGKCVRADGPHPVVGLGASQIVESDESVDSYPSSAVAVRDDHNHYPYQQEARKLGSRGPAASAAAASSTTGTVSVEGSWSTTTTAAAGCVLKLIDCFDLTNVESSREFRAARDYVDNFSGRRADDKDFAEGGLGASNDESAALDVPLVARYAFQVSTSACIHLSQTCFTRSCLVRSIATLEVPP